MSFDKEYPNRKDKRKKYYGSKSFDKTCRNHGSCPWCKRNRIINLLKNNESIKDKINEYKNNYDFIEDPIDEDLYDNKINWEKYF